MEKPLENKKIAIIIAFRDFRDEEYFIPKQTFEMAGAKITTVSTSIGDAVGKLGGEARVDLTLDELKVGHYNAIIFVGGPGAAKYIEDPQAHQIVQETADSAMILGAICVAPAILARAGVLAGKEATVWSSLMDKSTVKILKEEGVKYKAEHVVKDGNIITADGPAAAKEFAQVIIEAMERE